MHTRQVLRLAAAEGAPFIACSTFLCEVEHYKYRNAEDCAKDTALGEQGAGYYRCADAPPPDPYEQARAILLQASAAGADFIRCAEPLDGVELPLYEYRTNGPDGPGYYRLLDAPPPSDPIEHARGILREAAAAGAEFIRCDESVGELGGYDYRADGDDGAGYYRRDDAQAADPYEYSRIVLRRASAAGADFVACAEFVMALPGYEHRDGADGLGYYRLDHASEQGPPPSSQAADQSSASADSGAFDAFMNSMKELGAI